MKFSHFSRQYYRFRKLIILADNNHKFFFAFKWKLMLRKKKKSKSAKKNRKMYEPQ